MVTGAPRITILNNIHYITTIHVFLPTERHTRFYLLLAEKNEFDVKLFDQIDHVVAAVTDLPNVQRNQVKSKFLQITDTNANVQRPKKKNSKEFDRLPFNHIRTFQKKLSEEGKLRVLLSLYRKEAVVFWQTHS